MKTINTRPFLTVALAIAASVAFADPVQFEADGVLWTVTNGDEMGAPITALHLTPGFSKMCPEHRVKFEAVSANAGGIAMSEEQKFRGDRRWRIVCDRS